ncbi:MAG: 1-acyl-sn-glycerol-3-phosphate acyltransferase [Bdellovibrionaceae bacterium]|nr:1-acyl-sn-glycerol-3-phosphate acyltransferase [Pseudobdellovibrionaceae bacterium]
MQRLMSVGKTLSMCAQTYGYLSRSRRPGADLAALKQSWAEEMLSRLGVKVQITGEISLKPGLLYVGNHISYLDIPLLMAAAPGIAFVAKKEIGDWPLFGDGARALETIFVQRESAANRGQARQTIAASLEQGRRIAVFPAGTTSLNETKSWRRGAFEIAQEKNAEIQPFRLRYSPLRTAAFINDDALIPHMSKLMRSQNISAQIEFHPPVRVKNAAECCEHWQAWVQEGIHG